MRGSTVLKAFRSLVCRPQCTQRMASHGNRLGLDLRHPPHMLTASGWVGAVRLGLDPRHPPDTLTASGRVGAIRLGLDPRHPPDILTASGRVGAVRLGLDLRHPPDILTASGRVGAVRPSGKSRPPLGFCYSCRKYLTTFEWLVILTKF